MKIKVNYYWLLLLIPLFFICWFFISSTNSRPVRFLPYFGPRQLTGNKDTAFHTIPAFSFTDQDNMIYTRDSATNKIYVTEYFFTTCQSICPIMNSNLQGVYQQFRHRKDFL